MFIKQFSIGPSVENIARRICASVEFSLRSYLSQEPCGTWELCTCEQGTQFQRAGKRSMIPHACLPGNAWYTRSNCTVVLQKPLNSNLRAGPETSGSAEVTPNLCAVFGAVWNGHCSDSANRQGVSI